jgi:hypothetical protein
MNDREALAKSRARRGEVIGNNYVLDDVLGIGGMGVVHAAMQRSLERTVAVKLPRPELVDDHLVRALFRTEALTGSRVTHRNIVAVLDFGDDGGVPYLVMEHIVGPRLGQMLHEVGSLAPASALQIVRQIVAGLEEAHANGIVHGDVKCDNVLVQTLRDGSMLPRLIDFGIARFLDESIATYDAVVTGTPEYIAPEVARGARPTPAADVYAIGVMLYELVTGTTPFDAETASAIMASKLETEATPMSVRRPELDIPEPLDELVTWALARDPAHRPTDARALARALDAIAKPAVVAAPRLAAGTGPVFSTEAVTATMAAGGTPELEERPSLAERRMGVVAAIRTGSIERIATAYLALAQALVERRQHFAAQAELEEGIELLMTPGGRGPVWRLLLTLATLYERHGERARARLAARAARDQADDVGSEIGRARSEQLCDRLR